MVLQTILDVNLPRRQKTVKNPRTFAFQDQQLPALATSLQHMGAANAGIRYGTATLNQVTVTRRISAATGLPVATTLCRTTAKAAVALRGQLAATASMT